MPNKIQLHQLFYGHDGTQYRVLATSIPELSGRFGELCERIGTPDRPGEIVPFLMSVPLDGKIIMVQVTSGRKDNVGRKTIFFHAFVVEQFQAKSYAIDAFSLQEQGFFSSIPVSRPLEIDSERLSGGQSSLMPPFNWDGQALALIAPEPAGQIVHSLLGRRVNDCAWSTFSFQALKFPFKLYVLSDRAPIPQGLRCCDTQGKMYVAQARNSSTVQEIPKEPRQTDGLTKNPFRFKVVHVLLVLSILLNVVLLLTQPAKEAGNPVEQEPVLTDALREEARLELKNKFPEGKKIEDWENVLSTKSFKSFVKQYPQMELLGEYISFVNTEILSDTKGTNP